MGQGPAAGESSTVHRIEDVFREDHGRLLAYLAGRFGDLDLAEEIASDAMETALRRWPADGVPDRPLAWLITTARRKGIDRVRRDQVYAQRLAELRLDSERAGPAVIAEGDELPDERLELLFTCCHPALPFEARTALTLRFLSGLSTREVADAFVVSQAAMAQRLARAKRKIRDARIPFRVPAGDELRARMPAVLRVIYLIFTQGYAASGGKHLLRIDLCAEAVRLARILHRLMPGERDAAALLALLLLTDSRRAARVDADGTAVSLEDQDRTLWDADLIAEGRQILAQALDPAAGSYGLQAAIAALHAEAPDVQRTDWTQIAALYGVLHARTGSPVVALNRAVAVAMRDGPAAGLALLDEIGDDERLRGYHPLPAARADLLRRLGRPAQAADAYREALALVGNESERRFLACRLAEVTETAGGR